jgi:hypothetical protein
MQVRCRLASDLGVESLAVDDEALVAAAADQLDAVAPW